MKAIAAEEVIAAIVQGIEGEDVERAIKGQIQIAYFAKLCQQARHHLLIQPLGRWHRVRPR